MSKWVGVRITISKIYAVEIQDDETVEVAEKVALDECAFFGGAAEVDGTMVATSNEQLDSMIRHADEKFPL